MLNIPEGYSDRQICVMGLGYVGLTMAVVMADIGFEVTGVEISEKVVNDLKNGIPHFHEPGLQGRLRNVIRTGNLVPVQRIPSPSKSSVYIITVGTPLVGEKEVRLDMIQNVTKEIAEHLKDGDMIIMRSTVRPGTTRKYVLPILEATGKKFDLVFCPERTLEGQALAELRYLPQIVGGVDADARVRATRMFNFITPTVVQVSDAETAEMIKLIDNSQRDVQFALSNEIARMSDKIGISAAEVISAGKLAYPRTNLPFPGPVGGPCLEKDSYILEDGIKDYGLRPDIIMTARTVNEIQPAESAHYIKKLCDKLSIEADRMVITLVGLAFKGRPETDDLRGTMAYPILRELRNAFPTAKFRGFDAIVENDVIRQEFDIEPVDSLEEAFEGSSLVVVANNHKIFELCPLRELSESMYGPAVIYDFWNHFSNASLDLPKSVVYTGLGKIGQTLKSLETL
jgi:UDP-N-acetyl-D-mannosaminuronic acid dehydrogenase